MDQAPKQPSDLDLEALRIINIAGSRMALMPVIFNGESRTGIVLPVTNTKMPYVKLIAILPRPEDQIVNLDGKTASTRPPLPKTQLN